jgi:hypothetical protein
VPHCLIRLSRPPEKAVLEVESNVTARTAAGC